MCPFCILSREGYSIKYYKRSAINKFSLSRHKVTDQNKVDSCPGGVKADSLQEATDQPRIQYVRSAHANQHIDPHGSKSNQVS